MKRFARICLWSGAVVFGFLLAGEMEQYDQMSAIERAHEREFAEAKIYDHLKLALLLGAVIVLRRLSTSSWF